jgi:predicted butyrate kinase (DUF1464 family)
MKVNIGKYPKDVAKDRKISVIVEPHDTWSMDSTLAYIIHPMLVQLKDQKTGASYVDDEDVPEEFRSTAVSPKKDEWDVDDNWFNRWDWIMDEMIWAFETINTDWEKEFYTPPAGEWSVENLGEIDIEGRKKVQDRLTNGFRLFGKYYQSLWD